MSGLGLGLLAAPAVVLARSVADVASLGVTVLRLAFRLGVHVHQVSRNLHCDDLHDDAPRKPWAFIIPNVDVARVEQELDVVHREEVRVLTLLPRV